MSARHISLRPSAARCAGALLALGLLATGCSGGSPEESPESPAPVEAGPASDAGGASDGGGSSGADGASDGGGQTAAEVPSESIAVTPAPEGFTPPAPCSGEGAHLAKVGGAASPELPERAGETLTITAEGVDGAEAQLSAAVGGGTARSIEDITLGETVTIDLWTISVTSVCEDSQQVEFDLID